MLWQKIRTDVVVMETATAFWSVLLSPRYAIMGEVIEFINVSFPYSYPEKFKYLGPFRRRERTRARTKTSGEWYVPFD
jgi:hypothetical protein